MYGHTFMHINNLCHFLTSIHLVVIRRVPSHPKNCSGDGWGYVHEQSGLPYDLDQHERHKRQRLQFLRVGYPQLQKSAPPTYDKTVTVRQLYYDIGYGDCFHVNLVVVATRSIFSKA